MAVLAALVSATAGCGAPPRSGHDRARSTGLHAAPARPVHDRWIVPRPRYERLSREHYPWRSRVRILSEGSGAGNVAAHLRAYLFGNGTSATMTDRTQRPDVVLSASNGYDRRLGNEGYVLEIRRGGVSLRANDARGLFYGLQTLEQLSIREGGHFVTRAGTVVDWPAYRWRGVQLDVARHFFPVSTVERAIDVAAHYKLNTLHWHLTDDQAWRLASRRYPALTEGREHYTAADVRDVVAYAARRYVDVVPEIEMPAHTGAALRAYPGLACDHRTLCTRGEGLRFAHAVLDEAMAQFPSPYVHTGGDEVPPGADAAQPAFTAEIERYVQAHGRRLVGWDEILTPHLSARAVVMAWTSQRRAAQAVRHGNDVVLASGALYFDAAQGDATQERPASPHMATLEQVYDYGMVPDGIRVSDRTHVLGAQANVWTERIATREQLFTMMLPRELALAENVWTPRERKDWNAFVGRLPAQFAWLDAHHDAFRIPNVSFDVSGARTAFEAVPHRVQSVDAWTASPSLTIRLRVPLDGARIRYTTDGTMPQPTSPVYSGPFTVGVSSRGVDVRAAAFLHGRRGTVTECTLRRTSLTALRARRQNAAMSWASLVSP